MPEQKSLKRFTIVRTMEEGTLIAGALESAGIEAHVIDKTFHAEPIPMSRLFNRVEIHVAEDQLDQAKKVLADMEELERHCPQCNALMGPDELYCEACGEPPPAA
jgi:hypothetical protein